MDLLATRPPISDKMPVRHPRVAAAPGRANRRRRPVQMRTRKGAQQCRLTAETTLRHRHPGWRQRRLRLRAPRRRARPDRRPRREGQARRHLPARRLHPDQGAAARGRGRRHRPRGRSSSASRRTFESVDMAGVNAYKDGVVGRLYKGLQGLVKATRIDVRRGRGPAGRPSTRRGRRPPAAPARTSSWPPAPTPGPCPAWRSAAGS